MSWKVVGAVFFLCFGGFTVRGVAEPIVYESFSDYSTGSDVVGQNGGIGFASNWAGRRNLLNSGSNLPPGPASTILASSLAYFDGSHHLITSGGSLFITGQNGNLSLARTVDQSLLPDQPVGESTYISFLGRRSGAAADPNDPVYGGSYPWGSNLYPRNAGVNLFGDDGGDATELSVGNPSNVVSSDVWRLRGQDLNGTSKDPKSTVPFGAGSLTTLVVLRVDHGIGDGGADRINLWVNPVLAAESSNGVPAFGDWEKEDDPLKMQPGWIGVSAGDAGSNRPFAEFTFDEFRIGATWGDVTPYTAVPEPSTLMLALMVGGVRLMRRVRM